MKESAEALRGLTEASQMPETRSLRAVAQEGSDVRMKAISGALRRQWSISVPGNGCLFRTVRAVEFGRTVFQNREVKGQ